ncbi:phage tail sheath family protein [Bowmanella pacifica]|uniref:Phage tail sheath family protein n=1 Tax=Bowmanella pacifica TaxID=502051 RepID=A0A918DJ36_9ALTE|nr:phage tail sheath C-terminal domain-containing protein [Bowmanella pacifica]GGO69596.1 hypothetical protein GCM10010982_21140 [Bowmanella pacifica]
MKKPTRSALVKSPGVYIKEIASPLVVRGVATSIPAFVGYTRKCSCDGQTWLNQAVKISSFQDFVAHFGDSRPPYFYFQSEPQADNSAQVSSTQPSVLPCADSRYYLAQAVKLFFQNGGQQAYIVSVGEYAKSSEQRLGSQPNRHIQLQALMQGLAALKLCPEPSLYLCPDAIGLNDTDYSHLVQAMLAQAGDLDSAFCLLDVPGADFAEHNPLDALSSRFRQLVGYRHLSYGAAYLPFINTALFGQDDITYLQLQGGNSKGLNDWLNPDGEPKLEALIAKLPYAKKSEQLTYHHALLALSPIYRHCIEQACQWANLQPASGAVCGCYSQQDAEYGVWKAPANIALRHVVDLPVNISNDQQDGLNIDAASGISINALRVFIGQGVLIWGARTMAGNSEWRYVPVRRTAIFIKQSLQTALNAMAFEHNDAHTWIAARDMTSDFLQRLWRQGGLCGAKAEDAYFVRVGLGQTMTAKDILDKRLVVQVGLALTRPAEFVVIKLEQQLAD